MIKEVQINEIVPNPNQPRKHFDEESIRELAESIQADGLQSPILVRPKDGRFEIVQGERRYRAHEIAGLETIRAEVREITDDDAFHLAVIENIQREQLTAIEEAQAFLKYTELGMTHEEIAKRVSKTRDYITSKLRLLQLSQPIQDMIARREIKEGHAKQILRLKPILNRICTKKTVITFQFDLFELFQQKFTHYFWDKKPISVNDVKNWVNEWHYALILSSIRQTLTYGSCVLYRYGRDRMGTSLTIDMFCHLYGNEFKNLTEDDFEFAADYEKELLKHSYDREFRKWTIDKFYDSVRYNENPITNKEIQWIEPSDYRFVMMLDAARNDRRDEEQGLQIIDDVERYYELIDEIIAVEDTRNEYVFVILHRFYTNHSDASIDPQELKYFHQFDEVMRQSGHEDFTTRFPQEVDGQTLSYESLVDMRLLIELFHRVMDSEGKPRMSREKIAHVLRVNFTLDTGEMVPEEVSLDYYDRAMALGISQGEIDRRLREAEQAAEEDVSRDTSKV